MYKNVLVGNANSSPRAPESKASGETPRDMENQSGLVKC